MPENYQNVAHGRSLHVLLNTACKSSFVSKKIYLSLFILSVTAFSTEVTLLSVFHNGFYSMPTILFIFNVILYSVTVSVGPILMINESRSG